MRDFPPVIRAYTDRGADEPDTRTPLKFLWWMVRANGVLFWVGLFTALLWMVPQTVGPWMVGRAIDTGIVPANSAETARWVLVLTIVTLWVRPAASRSTPSSCGSGSSPSTARRAW